jgi:predicted MFS family arabinose efflux permease
MGVPASNAYIIDAVDERDLSIAFAVIYVTIPAAQLVGPGIGRFLAEQIGMRPVFY